jgi:RNA polymerase sigma-70 factor (ECF subfamily)
MMVEVSPRVLTGSAVVPEPQTNVTEQSEHELGVRAQRGDPVAFATIVERYQTPICGYLTHLLGDADDAFDLTQETFVRAFRVIGNTRTGLLVRPWLYRIATNLAYELLRRRRRFDWLRLADITLSDWSFCSDESEAVARTLATLRPEDRAVLLLCGLDGLSYAEAADILRTRPDAARMRFARAKRRFCEAYRSMARVDPR